MSQTIALIVPIYKESNELIQSFNHFSSLGFDQVICVDGGSKDDAQQIIRQNFPHVLFAPSVKSNRAFQMNLGALKANTDILLFAHIDMKLPTGCAHEIRKMIASGSEIGAFEKQYSPSSLAHTIYAFFLNMILLKGLRLAVGTNALFMTQEFFKRIGGFPLSDFMEDLELMKKINKRDRFQVVSRKVTVSARRYVQNGFLRQLMRNGTIFLLYYIFKVSPARLKKIYDFHS